MYISQLKINNYRSFKEATVELNDGINVIIGSNNSGKSNLLRALSILFDKKSSKKLQLDDFCKLIDVQELQRNPPKITIQATIKKGNTATDDDLAIVANWLTVLNKDYEAVLTYEFFLPENHVDSYKAAIKEVIASEEQDT